MSNVTARVTGKSILADYAEFLRQSAGAVLTGRFEPIDDSLLHFTGHFYPDDVLFARWGGKSLVVPLEAEIIETTEKEQPMQPNGPTHGTNAVVRIKPLADENSSRNWLRPHVGRTVGGVFMCRPAAQFWPSGMDLGVLFLDEVEILKSAPPPDLTAMTPFHGARGRIRVVKDVCTEDWADWVIKWLRANAGQEFEGVFVQVGAEKTSINRPQGGLDFFPDDFNAPEIEPVNYGVLRVDA